MTPADVTDDLATAYVKLKADHAQLRAHAARLEARVLGAEQAVAQVMRGARLDVGTTNTLIGRLWEALRKEGPPSTETNTLRANLEAETQRAENAEGAEMEWKDRCEDAEANLEALRAKAGAVYARGSCADHDALRAELAKPSGASLLAERDAWKALAKARRHRSASEAIAALAALRALGIDPEAK